MFFHFFHFCRGAKRPWKRKTKHSFVSRLRFHFFSISVPGVLPHFGPRSGQPGPGTMYFSFPYRFHTVFVCVGLLDGWLPAGCVPFESRWAYFYFFLFSAPFFLFSSTHFFVRFHLFAGSWKSIKKGKVENQKMKKHLGHLLLGIFSLQAPQCLRVMITQRPRIVSATEKVDQMISSRP